MHVIKWGLGRGSPTCLFVESSWNVMAHGDAREGKWRGNWRMECVVSTFHTISEHVVCSITTADVHTSAASSRLNWRPCRFKWTRPFRRKTKSGFCTCALDFKCSLPALWITVPIYLQREFPAGLAIQNHVASVWYCSHVCTK